MQSKLILHLLSSCLSYSPTYTVDFGCEKRRVFEVPITNMFEYLLPIWEGMVVTCWKRRIIRVGF